MVGVLVMTSVIRGLPRHHLLPREAASVKPRQPEGVGPIQVTLHQSTKTCSHSAAQRLTIEVLQYCNPAVQQVFEACAHSDCMQQVLC